MARIRIVGRLAALAFAAAALPGPPAAAWTGTVVDEQGRPIEGADACLMEPDRTLWCSKTAADGRFRLPDSEVAGIRVAKDGYLPADLAATNHEEPIVLALAASFRARLLDAETGEPIADGRLVLSYPTGFRRGPFPVSRGGLWVKSVEPGLVVPRGEAEGYESARGQPVDLVAGQPAAIELRLKRAASD